MNSRTRLLAISLSGLASLAHVAPTLAAGGNMHRAPGHASLAAAPSTAIALTKLPVSLQRRAAQLLEDMRNDPNMSGWAKGSLSSTATPFFRPDMGTTPAYYEIQVLSSDKVAAGFIMLTNGTHDYPISHWDHTGEAPSVRLATLANQAGKKAVTFYKLDSLSYAGEDANGNLVANLGSLPVKITGQDPAWLDQEQVISEKSWYPDAYYDSDKYIKYIGGKSYTSGPTAPPSALKLTGWSSWNELKDGYVSSYFTMMESLRDQAAQDWSAEEAIGKYGEGLKAGITYPIGLAYALNAYTMTGTGAKLVKVSLTTRTSPLPPVLNVSVLSASATPSPLTINVTYANGLKETINYQIVQVQAAATAQSASTARKAERSGGAQSSSLIAGAWSPWTIYWAGRHEDQRLYNQMPAGSYPNTSSCYSGCGATGWAMLFGWADNQSALGSSYWWPRNGLYRQSGGYGTDAVAPVYPDSGVNSMTWEIRNRIGTFCAFGSGATAPWDMSNAGGYFVNRTGATLNTHFNVAGLHEGRLTEYARNSIRDRLTPAIIGTGWLEHYPLAYGYASRSRTVNYLGWTDTEYNNAFYVNQGWGGSGNGWIGAGTWFAGEIRP